MTWGAALTDQVEFYWNVHLMPRLAGLTDEEYRWEPTPGCWSLRAGDDGRLEPDSLTVEPPIPPVTTIAWRIAHIGRDVLGKRARAFFGGGSFPDGSPPPDDVQMFDDRWWPEALPATAGDAVAFLQQAFELWRDGVASLDDDALLRPLGPKGGHFADDSMASLALHINREVIAHGAELCLLRDLFRADRNGQDPVVAAALRGDAAEVSRLLDAGAEPRPSLLVEVAGLRHWDVVRALVERGAAVDVGDPSPLHYAAAAGALDAVRLLVERGADPMRADGQFGMPSAGWADHFGHAEVAEYLRAVRPPAG